MIVPARTQVTAEAPDGGPPLVFETERALTALTAQPGFRAGLRWLRLHGCHERKPGSDRRDFNRLGR